MTKLSPEISKEQYYALCEEVWEHNRHYFLEHNPTISDYEFDQLLNKVVSIEKKHPDWVYPASPTQRVGEYVSGGFTVVPHRVPMLSLANTYSPEELQEFVERMYRLLHKKELLFSSELKMDGIAISLRYEKGFFIQGLTRGNGKEGEDITQNLLTIKNLPIKLSQKVPDYLEVRGEVFMPLTVFEELNKKREDLPFANPRNAAAGSLKLLDPSLAAKRHLDLMVYGIAEESTGAISSHVEALNLLETWGFPVVERALCESIDEILAFAKRIEKRRKTLPFEIDGVVVKVDDLSFQKKLGSTGKSQRWAVAYKFSPERLETQVKEITVQVGRTGVLTPVAELEPIFLAGSTISRATLHNEDEVKRKDIRVHDTVYVEKGGDVIPKVVGVNLDQRPPHTKAWIMPTHCPVCGAEVQRSDDEVAVRCPNTLSCPAQELKRIIYFAGKSGMDIEHLGEKVAMQLVEKGFIKKISDIYSLTENELFQLKNFKEKAVKNLLDAIEKSKKVSLSRFIMALGIKHVGAETAELLAERAGDIETLSQMSEEELMQIEGIGHIVAESIVAFFSERENLEEIKILLHKGVKPKVHEVKGYQGHPFFGKSFVLTGALTHFTRDHAASLIKERGGKVSGSVTKTTDYLLAGEDPGSKYEKAKKLQIPIMTEKEFMESI